MFVYPVCRYGGINLGPARFSHIETCAEEVCRKFKLKEDVADCVSMLCSLDDILSTLRSEYASLALTEQPTATKKAPNYAALAEDLELAKLKRLVVARESAIKSVKQLLKKVQDAPPA